MIEMIVDRVQVSLMSQHRLVVLRDTQEERYLPIWIGAFESEAITLELQGMLRERPLTHDLLKATITEMGGAVRHIFINNLSKDVFYAQINIEVNGDSIDIDSRPSDAIALAVRLKAPIYVDKQVMDKAGIRPDRNVEPEILGLDDEFADSMDPSEKVDETKLSAFADFVDTLNLDDFDEDE
ncbi:MAG: bifunctional nuclease family protein [Chloroflexi bacterium]|nr:bifunctional nuclease family protein [Chloroflexota bacterium]MCY4539108.1 bifunctional nuclease family protein [Chloroflexota bacterium]